MKCAVVTFTILHMTCVLTRCFYKHTCGTLCVQLLYFVNEIMLNISKACSWIQEHNKVNNTVCWWHMKNVINYGTPQHKNDKDQNAQTVPRRTLAFLGTWPCRQHYRSHRMSYPQPTISTPEAPISQLSINFKNLSQIHYCTKHSIYLKSWFLSIKFSSNCFR
jgi:hypothetical protein